MFDLGAEEINVILSVALPAQRPPSIRVCLDLFSISLPWFIQHFIAVWLEADLDLAWLAPGVKLPFLRQCLAALQKIRLNKLSLSFTLILGIFGKKRLFQLMLMFLCNFCSLWYALALFCSDLAECQWGFAELYRIRACFPHCAENKPQIKQVKGGGAINKWQMQKISGRIRPIGRTWDGFQHKVIWK